MLIDPKSNVPIFRQIVDQIRDAIDAGVYRPGEALPSLRALALEVRVNPNTVQRAYEELDREGVVESRRGLGVFVRDRGAATARNGAERRASSNFTAAISAALAAGVTPTRVRELFESALGTGLKRARKVR